MTERIGKCLGALAVCVVVAAPRPAGAEPRLPPPPEVIDLPAPEASVLADRTCTDLKPAHLRRTVTLKRTLFDDFHDFDPLRTLWTPYYVRPHDPIAAHTHDHTDEQQVYVDPSYRGTTDQPLGLNPFSREKGSLAISAERIAEDRRASLHGRLYTSGMIQNSRTFRQRYGYFEISVRLPAGKALWPAFWLVPANPANPPELDVFETLGKDPETIYSTIHWDYKNPKEGHAECRRKVPGATEKSVVYGALWTPEVVVYYTDRVPVQAVRTHPTMVRPMYMILNLGVGGKWPGYVAPDTPEKVTMVVDWIAAYQLDPLPVLTGPNQGQ